MKQLVTTYYLHMQNSNALRPAIAHDPSFFVQRAEIPIPELNRFLYTSVGDDWYWVKRLNWSYARWLSYLQRPELETWIGYAQGTPAGFFELERQAQQTTEIAIFGLLPQFIGRGIGGALLTAALEQAWRGDTQQVLVHTCSLDGPSALQNYYSRGFQLHHQDTHEADLPDVTPEPWPGAERHAGQ